ncbi:MAG TPA: ATP-binding protein [Opitutaceae bacterium]|nr:ATP-binding protein [Opitutaceae bacterium]
MKSWPLQHRIVAWSALSTGIALLTFGCVVAISLYLQQVEVIDNRLAESAGLLSRRHPPGAAYDPATLEAMMVAPRHRHQDATSLYGFVIVRSNDGTLLQAEPDALRAGVPPWPPGRRSFNRTIAGHHLRYGVFHLGDTTLLLVASLEPAYESVGDLAGAAFIAIPAVLLVVAAGSWWIARRALDPIRRMTSAAAAITTSNLNARLPEIPGDDPIAAHVRVLNEMFERLQRGFEQATRFTADAAHELRTPLTILRGQLEDALRGGRFDDEQETLLIALLRETTELQKIAENLLLLAQFDRGHDQLRRDRVSFSRVLEESREDAELLAVPHHITVQAEIAPEVYVSGDPVMLRRLALNLIDNAVKFNRPGGTVRLELGVSGDVAQFAVGNTGPGIPAERRSGLFTRFYRSETARSSGVAGSGLGLSLCREIAGAHDGNIALGRSESDWTEFVVRLPRAAG